MANDGNDWLSGKVLAVACVAALGWGVGIYSMTAKSQLQNEYDAQEEVFGPVLVVISYTDDDDAVRIANNSIYGLSGAVFGSPERAKAVARRIRTGTFSINGGNYFSPDSPFGGYKQSGIGREMGKAGLEEFLESKTLAEVVS